MRYRLDAESIARLPNPIEAVELLVDWVKGESWNRQGFCRRCEGWTTRDGPDTRPIRPYASDPLTGCSGCVLSMLDETLSGAPTLEQLLAIGQAVLARLHPRKQASRVAKVRAVVKKIEAAIEDRARAAARQARPGVRLQRYGPTKDGKLMPIEEEPCG